MSSSAVAAAVVVASNHHHHHRSSRSRSPRKEREGQKTAITTSSSSDSPVYFPPDKSIQRSPTKPKSPSYSPPPFHLLLPIESSHYSPTEPYESYENQKNEKSNSNNNDELCFVCQLRPHSPQKLDCDMCRFIDDSIITNNNAIIARLPSSSVSAAASVAVSGNCLRPIPKRISPPLPLPLS